MPSPRPFALVLTLFLCTAAVGCGPDVLVPVGTPTGNWLINSAYMQGNVVLPFNFGGPLIDTGSQVSGVFHIDHPCFSSGATDVPYTGTLDRASTLSIVSAPVAGQVLTMQGTLSNSSSLSNVIFAVNGGCSGNIQSLSLNQSNSASFAGTGVRISTLVGSWTPAPAPVPTLLLSEQLVQAQAPDVHGDFALSGTVTVQGSPCFSSGTLQPSSFVSGDSGHQTILMNDGSTLDAALIVGNAGYTGASSHPSLNLDGGTIAGGKCNAPVEVTLQ